MQPGERPLIIGVTGSIGSGKTTACKIIEQYYQVFYADDLAHKAYGSPGVREGILKRWGREALTDSGVNKKYISERVFNNREELDFLNSLIHPVVLIMMQKIVESTTGKTVFFEVPLLFEAKLEKCFDHIVYVLASPNMRSERLGKRDHLTEQDITKRIHSQLKDEIKAAQSDTIIENNLSKRELKIKVETFLSKLDEIDFRPIIPFSGK